MSAALPSAAAGAAASGSAHPLVSGPIASTLVRLAVPNMVALSMSVLVAVAETYYVGQLGTVSLAAMALVFPLAMLTQMMSNGAMGSGVSSAISRALGAGDGARASALALHAIVIGAIAGLLYSLIFVLCGATFYGWLGGRGEVLAAATGFGAVLFSGAILVWLCNTLASVVRGTGNMRMPSAVIFAASLVQIVVGGTLGLGLGPMPRWGMPGVAVGNIVAMLLAVAAFLAYLQWGQQRLQLDWRTPRLAWPMFRDILRVGALACLSPVQTALAALLLTGMVARLGPLALAGYGIGQRLEFLLIPMAFGVGMAAVPMVGMAMGAGQVARARRVAWSGGAMAAALLGVLGLVVMVWPQLWSGIFTSDPAVRAYADLYLRTVGPAFGLFGLGLVLYFASLGAGRVWAPVLAGTVRLLIVVVGGGWLMSSGLGSAQSLFILVAVAMAAYGAGTAWAVWRARWG
ncbi:MAG: MATE family efflux transporter [Delftia acidovorans]|jgi:putative MATE family efflux protein|nr:MATE family efflux transporter [Delftia acidovorans]